MKIDNFRRRCSAPLLVGGFVAVLFKKKGLPSLKLLRFHEAGTVQRWREYGVLIAASGGADSTALLHCFAGDSEFFLSQGLPAGKLAVAHINHGLRGTESDADALFVQKLAEQYGLRYFEYRIKPADWDSVSTGSLEGTARQIRYRFLAETAEQLGFRYTATAHTADDQTETVLHRIFRGTGLSGLAGIRSFRQLSEAVTLIRPLRNILHTEILDYLQSLNATFRTDSSNLENRFTRNRIRNRFLPLIRKECNPKVDDAVRRLAQLSEDNETVLDELFQNVIEQMIVRKKEHGLILDRTALQRWSSQTQRELFVRLWKKTGLPLREMGQLQWEKLTGFLSDSAKQLELPGGVCVRKEEHTIHLHFALRPATAAEYR